METDLISISKRQRSNDSLALSLNGNTSATTASPKKEILLLIDSKSCSVEMVLRLRERFDDVMLIGMRRAIGLVSEKKEKKEEERSFFSYSFFLFSSQNEIPFLKKPWRNVMLAHAIQNSKSYSENPSNSTQPYQTHFSQQQKHQHQQPTQSTKTKRRRGSKKHEEKA